MSGATLTAAAVLAADPPIFYVRPRPIPFGLAGFLAKNSKGIAMTCIVRTMWTFESGTQLVEMAPIYRGFRALYPNIRLVIAANTERELDLLRGNGMEAILANHNMFVEEGIFQPLPDVTPRYDAIYNANFSPFKRRELAAEIPSCIHLGYFSDVGMRKEQLPLYEMARQQLPHHTFMNPVAGEEVVRLQPKQVNALLAEARVGLCLSAEEGAMIASMEYLMAGLPVVSTPSLGGRERYFDPDVTLIAEANPRAVAEAVAALKARDIPRAVVREKTLRLVARDRDAFNGFIDSLREGHAPFRSPKARFRFTFTPNLYIFKTVAQFCKELGFPETTIGEPPGAMDLLEIGLPEEQTEEQSSVTQPS
jgi:glycosyltransferase involved in cell wall biosynthesis